MKNIFETYFNWLLSMFLMAYISIKEKYIFQKVNAGKPPNIIHLSYSKIVRKSKKNSAFHFRQVFSVGIILEDAHLNWPNWFRFLIQVSGLFTILIRCMIFLSPILDVIRMFMSIVFLHAQLGYRILCLQNVFLWLLI